MRFFGVCRGAIGSLAKGVQATSKQLAESVQRLSPMHRRVVLSVAAAAALVAVVSLLYLFLHPPETRTASPVIVGKALIGTASVPLQSEARDEARSLGTLSLGEPVEILGQLPAKALDAWVAVRRQSEPSAIGYVRLRQLSSAYTGFSEFDLWHASSAIPDPNKSDPAELRLRLNDAEAALARLLEGTESVQLQLQLANGHALLAKRALPDYATAGNEAERAQHYLDRLKGQGSVSAECARVSAILDAVMKAIPAKTSGSAKSAPLPAGVDKKSQRPK
jgi:hypothetical protein